MTRAFGRINDVSMCMLVDDALKYHCCLLASVFFCNLDPTAACVGLIDFSIFLPLIRGHPILILGK